MGGFFGVARNTLSSTTVAALGSRLTYASPTGGAVAAAPVGFNGIVGRLLVTLGAGDATWISLTAGTDGQLLEIRNTDATHTLTLPSAQWGGVGDHTMPPGNAILTYYDSTQAAWQVTAP